jgi:hypothetical protein
MEFTGMDLTRSTTAALAKTLESFAPGMVSPETAEDLAHQQAVIELLHTFNPGVQNSFFANGVQGLEPLTTAEGYARMQKKYTNWRAAGIRELNLVLCDFLSFTLDPVKDNEATLSAVAYSFEKWVFVYENGDQKPTRGSVDRYVLRHEGGGWKVDSVMTYAAEG